MESPVTVRGDQHAGCARGQSPVAVLVRRYEAGATIFHVLAAEHLPPAAAGGGREQRLRRRRELQLRAQVDEQQPIARRTQETQQKSLIRQNGTVKQVRALLTEGVVFAS